MRREMQDVRLLYLTRHLLRTPKGTDSFGFQMSLLQTRGSSLSSVGKHSKVFPTEVSQMIRATDASRFKEPEMHESFHPNGYRFGNALLDSLNAVRAQIFDPHSIRSQFVVDKLTHERRTKKNTIGVVGSKRSRTSP
jgi:hypothetical protein